MQLRIRPWLATTVAVGAVAAIVVAGPASADAAPNEAALNGSVSASLVAARGAQARASFATMAAPLETLVEPKRYSSDRRWVFGGSVIRVPDTAIGSPVTALFLARWTGRTWTVALEGTSAFAAAARTAPVLDGEERSLFTAATLGTPTGLALPWKQGQGWAHWGVHGNSGTSRPYNSIDFYGGDGRVLASRGGRMYRFCTSGRWPFIKVVHDNGYTTGYYHLSSTTTKGDGATVTTGEYLGLIDVQLPCGGRANGDHVHWTLWRTSDGAGVAVNGKDIGGWTWFEQPTAYQGWAERNGQRVFRNTCCPIVNYGGGGDPGLPTGVVDTGTFDTVNIRSGPGTTFAIVGTATDGQVIQISCTARGSSVTGPFGTTDLWDRMRDGGYISDAFVDTGSNDPVAPACT